MDLCIEIEGVTEAREILERKMCVRLDLGVPAAPRHSHLLKVSTRAEKANSHSSNVLASYPYDVSFTRFTRFNERTNTCTNTIKC